MVNELFYYNYLFYFPNLFNIKLNKDQFEVRFKFIQVFGSINIEKVFWVREFVPFKISNQRKANIKKHFIQLVLLFKKYDLIEDKFKVISNGNYYFRNELDFHDISEGFVIYEKLSL